MNLFRMSRIVIDDEQQSIVFENCLRPKSFWNLFPIPSVTCTVPEITNVKTYTTNGERCLLVETATANAVFLESEVPDFQRLVGRVKELKGQFVDG